MKLGPVNKLNKKNQATSKKIDNDVMSVNCDVIVKFSVLWPIWSNLEASFRMHSLQNLPFHYGESFILQKLKAELKKL